MRITIDPDAGFCSGVMNAIKIAEKVLNEEGHLYCLGDIVHNEEEIKRLEEKGLQIIDYERFKELENCKVLIRAHGEPPETYRLAKENNIQLLDASCPIVLGIQKRIQKKFLDPLFKDHQFVIYGKKDHPEVLGLNGQIGNKAVIVSDVSDLDKLDLSKSVILYAQTTKSKKGFENIKNEIYKTQKGEKVKDIPELISYNTLCRQVSGRDEKLVAFSKNHDVIVFVSGKKSSNGIYLFHVCQSVNPNSYMISSSEEIDPDWFETDERIGISGATSTPRWLLEKVASHISSLIEKQ
ncbi:4-hydroxy-3-methylbut-2-enyl diphosphate reductase [Bacteroidota bacterium]